LARLAPIPTASVAHCNAIRRISARSCADIASAPTLASGPTIRTFADIDLQWFEPIARSCMHDRNRLSFCRGRGILRGPGKVNALSGTRPGAYIKPLDMAW